MAALLRTISKRCWNDATSRKLFSKRTLAGPIVQIPGQSLADIRIADENPDRRTDDKKRWSEMKTTDERTSGG